MRPRSGASSPAIMLTSVVLPEPDGPNTPVTPAGGLEARGEREVAQPLFDVDREHRHSPWKRMPARRASHSDGDQRARARSTIATSTSRPAAASPPGTCVSV